MWIIYLFIWDIETIALVNHKLNKQDQGKWTTTPLLNSKTITFRNSHISNIYLDFWNLVKYSNVGKMKTIRKSVVKKQT